MFMQYKKNNCKSLFCVSCILLFLLLSCKNESHKQDDNGSPETPDIDIAVNNMSKEQAIEKVQYEVRRTQKKITINVNYWEFENKRVPCTQYDVDLGRNCSGEGAGAPYGYKTVPEQVQKCCRQKDIFLSNLSGQWVADYSQTEDKWKVGFEFSIDDAKQVFSWIVSDNTGDVSDN